MMKSFLLLFVIFIIVPFSVHAQGLKAQKFLKENFKTHDFRVTSCGNSTASDAYELFVVVENGRILAYLVLSAAKGRMEMFDFALLLDPELSLLKVKVLTYRSSYGYQVTNKKWLRQFVGVSAGEQLLYGKHIDALTGASISAPALVSQVNLILKQLKENPCL